MWKLHGTKILGGLIVICGSIATMDAAQLTSLFGRYAGEVATIVGGLLVILRGFQNSKVNGA